jgi:hypothetical protein
MFLLDIDLLCTVIELPTADRKVKTQRSECRFDEAKSVVRSTWVDQLMFDEIFDLLRH